MKTILVPTDFSGHSIYGLEYAANIAGRSRAKLCLFNVAQTGSYYYSSDPIGLNPPVSIMMEGINENLKKTAVSKLESLSRRKFLKGLNVAIDCDTSPNVHNTILEYSESIKADLIVMGTKGSGNVKSILLGSTAERVVRFSPRPVVVIPGKIKKPGPKVIVFASDFREEAYGIFPVVLKFAKLFKAEISLLKVNTMDQFNSTADDKDRMNVFNKKFGGKFETIIYNDYMKEEGILHFAYESGADLIAIGTHGKRGLRRFFSEDVSEGIVRLSSVPIMIVNLKKFKSKSDIISK
jgi:nucleotide-binding universal stress UspA family protein